MFDATAKAELAKPLDPAREKKSPPGKYGTYIEGWWVIAEANRIFGFDGWSRETVEIRETSRQEAKVGQNKDPGWHVSWFARVRITVFGTNPVNGEPQRIEREGCAVGNGVSKLLYEAIESAAKEAETDAMKRAFITFGMPFGLALYDKSREFIAEPEPTYITDDQAEEIKQMAEAAGVKLASITKRYNIEGLNKLEAQYFEDVKTGLNATRTKAKEGVN